MKRPLGSTMEIEVLTEKGGAPSLYTEEIPDLCYRMFRLGFTIAQVAANLGVNESTLALWMRSRDEVRKAYDDGRWESLLTVEESLWRRANGYEYEETKIYSGVDSLGRDWQRQVTTLKRVEPDTTALIYYTKNRYPERWRDTWNIGQGQNLTQVNITNTLNLDTLSEEDKKLVARMAMARIIEDNDIDTSE